MTGSLKELILKSALVLAEKQGYREFSREAVASLAGTSPAAVSYHLGTMADVRDAVMVEAVAQKSLAVIAQGLIDGHPVAQAAPFSLRRLALDSLL